ncbi:hypothetical protein GOP47_0003304 [Adiantum capillus-veneris]|uniref:Pentatricopeptide repeat-containing protein n=1 Tax=Adiantum capillus-veneris TaxID=13818 RepID=A0A9D4ZRQ2_ADICA|nr:hypothetical protein GOP47_0003304 [Adiantum capillus-veneris]
MARSFLHRDYDRFSSHCWDHGIRKLGGGFPGVKNRICKECLWIDNPSCTDGRLDDQVGELPIVCDSSFPLIHGGSAFVASLRACAKRKDLQKGIRIHHHISEKGLLKHCTDALVTMYAKCGELAKAKELLDMHNSSDVFSWTDVIAGYAQKGQGHEALNCFEKMQREGLSPDGVTYLSVLKACGSISSIKKGEEIHDEIARQGLLDNNVALGNALVDMYAKCGALGKAQEVLQELPNRDVVSWSTVIAGYAQQGQGEQALRCFECMQGEGISPNAVTCLCALKGCGCIGAIDRGKQIHDMISRQGFLEDNDVLGNALVDMYAKCGAFGKAQEVLDKLPMKDVVTWNSLIGGLRQQGKAEQALICFERMLHEGICPDEVSFLCILKACGSMKAFDKGRKIHDEVLRQGLLGKNVALGNAVVDMYAKCGAFSKAQQVLEELPARNIVSWNALITEYAQQGQSEQALACFELMKREGFSPDIVSYLSILKACGSIGAADLGEQIHDEITSRGLLTESIVLGNALVDMHAKCGAFAKAQQVLEELSVRDVVSWNALITGYAQYGQCELAFNVFARMKLEGVSPNKVTFLSILKACGSIRAAAKGERVYDEIARLGLLENDDVLGTALVDMYAKCGALIKAQEVLETQSADTVFSWNALISGYVQLGQAEQALGCFDSMQQKGLSPDSVTFLCILKACANLGAADKGEQIHNEIINEGLLEHNVMLGNALVDMYAKCGALEKAREVLEELPVRDMVSWSTLIAGYVDHDKGEQALDCFEQMKKEGFLPNAVSLLCILKACGSIGAIDKGEKFHDEIARMGLLGNDISFSTAVVDMYAKCGALSKAQQVLEELPHRTVVAWNALISGYVQHNQSEQAVRCVERMQSEGLSPDVVTFLCVLKVCGTLGALDKGEAVHDEIVKQDLLKKSILLGNALVDTYAKCGACVKAQQVFEELSTRDVVTWSALIGGYARQGQGEQALSCFEKMQHEGLTPNLVTFLSVLKACGSIGAAEKGEQIYNEIARQGFLGNYMIGSALVDMYVKCGALAKAHSVLAELPTQNVASWNALIAGCAEEGNVEQALSCFDWMQQRGFSPDAMTFSCILKACGSIGSTDNAQSYMLNMSTKYGIIPDIQHYTCMIDVFARAGHLNKAVRVIRKLPITDHPAALWSTLLGACQKWGDLNVARWAFRNALLEDRSNLAVPPRQQDAVSY